MLFPRCGKVLVIDDCIEEVMPLLILLGKKGVSTMYFSGNSSELPEVPFDGIRLVFCDLKFNVASDAKSVASNVYSILKSLICKDNGPYILLVWSAHSSDYFDELKNILEKTDIKPEFMLPLNKGDYFSSENNDAYIDAMIEGITNLNLDTTDEAHVMEYINAQTLPLRFSQRKTRPNALEDIEQQLIEELKKANLFHLFVLWENTIATSAVETVNNLYNAIPDSIPQDKKLRAMLFYLARYKLEQQMKDSDAEIKFQAALDALNEIFSYFYSEKVHEIKAGQVELDKIEHLPEIDEISDAKFNQWKMIASANRGCNPGNVYLDTEDRFQYHGMIKPTKQEEYEKVVCELKAEADIKYILVDISSECDIAQKKLYVSRIVPGIMIPTGRIDEYIAQKKLKEKAPEYMFGLSPVEFQGKIWRIIINVNQAYAIPFESLVDKEPLYSITGSYVTAIKQLAAHCISKHGIGIFGKSG